MFKLIPGNNEYIISLSQEIRNHDGSIPNIQIVDGKIDISIYNEVLRVDLKWISLVAHFELYLVGSNVKNLLNTCFFNTNVTFLRPVSGKIPIFNKPIVIKSNGKIFRIIPAHARYAVSCDGEVIEIPDMKPVKVLIDRKRDGVTLDEYPSVYIYNPETSRYKYVYVHRLVAMAWVHNKDNDYVLRPIVNHIDGNKKNYYFKNLEWCSFRENNIHAVNTGLRSDNIECKIRDFHSGEVRLFKSLAQAEEYMGLISKTIRTNDLNCRKAKLINNRYEFKLLSDNTPWFYEGRTEKVKLGRYLITVTYQNKQVEYFHDTRDFKIKFKLWNCPKLSDLVTLARNLNPGVKFEITDFYHSDNIQAYDTKAKTVIETKTIVEMSKRTGISEGTIRYCVRGKEIWTYGGYAFRYKSDSIWDTNFVDRDKGRGTRFKAINTTNSEEVIFEAIRHAARFFRVDRGWIRSCLINGKELNGWKLQPLK